MTNPTVHIVLPIYNGEDYILQQLMSIYYQDYTNWFLYVINDGSTDGSIDIIQKFINDYELYSRILIIHNKKNIGLNGSIAVGLTEAKKHSFATDFVSFCDADDIWATNKLSIQIGFMLEHPSCDLSYHDLILINEYNNIITCSYFKILQKINNNIYNNTFGEFCTGQHVTATTIVFKSKFIDDVFPLPTYCFQDHRTMLVFSFLKRDIREVPYKLAYYRRHSKSMLSQKKEDLGFSFSKIAKMLRDLDIKYNNPLIKYYQKYNQDRSLWVNNNKFFLIQLFLILIYYPKIFILFVKKSFIYSFFRLK